MTNEPAAEVSKTRRNLLNLYHCNFVVTIILYYNL